MCSQTRRYRAPVTALRLRSWNSAQKCLQMLTRLRIFAWILIQENRLGFKVFYVEVFCEHFGAKRPTRIFILKIRTFSWNSALVARKRSVSLGLKALNLYLNALIFVKEIPDTEKNLNGKYIYVDKEKW